MSERQPGDERSRRVRSSPRSSRSPRPTTRSARSSPTPRSRRCCPALAYVTGDLSLLRADLRPDPLLVGMPQGGLTDEQQAEARALALDALVAFRDGGCRPAPPPADDAAARDHGVRGRRRRDGATTSRCSRRSSRTAARTAARRAGARTTSRPASTSVVLIIGAGMSGLLAAHRLQQAGVPFVILEKNDDVGGTWLENTYPGCRVDNPNHNYSYSFAQRHDWPFHFSTQDVLLDYFRRCADDVRAARAHPLRHRGASRPTGPTSELRWTRARARPPTATRRRSTANAVDQRGRPAEPPVVPGHRRPRLVRRARRSTRRAGTTTSTCAGKRVAVIGTGASAVQFIPEIAPDVGELLVFQRTPPWLGPTPDYHDRGVARACSGCTRTCRRTASGTASGSSGAWATACSTGVRVDPEWEPKDAVGRARRTTWCA